jgi:hypothetical protein
MVSVRGESNQNIRASWGSEVVPQHCRSSVEKEGGWDLLRFDPELEALQLIHCLLVAVREKYGK